ncbi:MAG: nitrite/sulfite reductase [Cellvibrionales bacterium TMED47]|nr:sulfite reductase [Porticoccaceae bacterium]RPG83377.1 MAG: nitrite/sulfite reductase [Cellvibrionales bacterium TMED47]|tara:strand:- start:85 stop:1749 length:1665 start_codon:yes stop_codon:yes gene_type:complete
MYKYDNYDHKIVNERVEQFRDQTQRYLAGEIADEEFLPLRLQNGLYVQRLAPMLRIAVPYGMLSSRQVRKLAHISRVFDKGYVHITTRQNVQLNWPALEEVPDILAELAEVEMHAIQTSGNCIRNTTTDQFAGVAEDEIEDPRPWCELIRQWSTLHPEFAFLPRKFKIAVCGSTEDRAAFLLHDIGLQLVKNDNGELGFEVFVGGGLGRTPIIGSSIRKFLPKQHLLSYLDAIVRVYNRYGNRDNKYKARIKILVKAWTPEVFAQRVEAEWKHLKDGPSTLTNSEISRVKSFFPSPDYKDINGSESADKVAEIAADNIAFKRWLDRNTQPQKQSGYRSVTLSLKPAGVAPGDVTDKQLETIADLADRFSFGELRATHNQNIVLTDVIESDLMELWQQAKESALATPTIGTINDMICCPGGDYCSLANAKSIPVAEAIQRKFSDLDYVYDLGDLELNISGCMNACGHHHVGHIGILGVDKKGKEWYQIQLGGSASKNASLAKVLGPSLSRDQITDGIEKLLDVYVENRIADESFLSTYQRIGIEKFKERVYAPST